MKKKLIAIVTSLAMVATMVPATAAAATQPGTAGTKTVAQAKSLSTFADALGKLPEPSTVTKANVDNNLSLYNTVYRLYQDLNATELSNVTDAQKQQMNAFKDALVAVYASLMADAIQEKASARKVTATETFTTIDNYEKKLINEPLNLKRAEVKEAVGTNTYGWYEEAQAAKGVAAAIAKEANNLNSTDPTIKKTAVENLEKAEGFHGVSEGTKAMAENYNIYRDAKDYLELIESADKLLKSYTERFTAQKKVVDANTVTSFDVDAAEALLDEADGSIALKRAYNKATSTPKTDYNAAHQALYNAINTATTGAKDRIEAQETANAYAALVDKTKVKADATVAGTTVTITKITDTDSLLNNLANIQQLYVMTYPSGTLVSAPWYVLVKDDTKIAANTAIAALQDYIKYGSTLTTANGMLDVSDAAAVEKLNKAILDQFSGIIPKTTTVDDRAMYNIANDVLKDVSPTLVGLELGNAAAGGVLDTSIVLSGDDADKVRAQLTALDTSIDGAETKAAADAVAFVNSVLKVGKPNLNEIDKNASDYEARLKDAQKAYDALDPAYKKGGSKYEEGIADIAPVSGGNESSVKRAYENANFRTTGGDANADLDGNYIPKDVDTKGAGNYSLRTLNMDYQMYKAGILEENQFKELVDGIDALPEASKLTINDKDAVYALQTKRDAMTEESQTAFETQSADGTLKKNYNSLLNTAIETIDALVAESVNAQIVALVKVKPTATQEEIAAAKAANKAARDAYEALTDSQKKAVTTYGFLEDAEAAVAAAEVQYAITQMTAALEGVDTANLTEDQAKAILAANSVINALPGAQKAEVEKAENYAAFQEAVKAASDKLGVKDPTDPIGPTGPSDLEEVAKVAKIAAQTYNGTAKTPAVTVKAGNKTLVKGTDYDVTYAKDHTSIGEVKVTITGKENYKGTITTSFIIKPGVVTLSKKPVAGKKQITVSYKTQKAQNSKKVGYRIICKTKGVKATAVNTTAAGKKTIKGLKSGKTYQVKVRAYKTIGGATYYGGYSKVQKVKVK